MTTRTASTWLIVGASRGIGFEFVRQLLARPRTRVICAARNSKPLELLLSKQSTGPGSAYTVLTCDVADEASIKQCCDQLKTEEDIKTLDYVVLNAGILSYPQRALEASMTSISQHLTTNAVGPIFMANVLLHTFDAVGSLVFLSSDSGSMGQFTGRLEDGFAAYAASKAALNMLLRHLGEELLRRQSDTVVLALHPGEVHTDMATSVDLPWEVQGTMSADESVGKMIPLIESKTVNHDGATFWNWDGTPHSW